jgi:hypothetical protein
VRRWWPGSRARLLSNATGVSEQGSSLALSTRRAALTAERSNPSDVVVREPCPNILVHGHVRSRAGRIPRNRLDGRFDGSCPEWIPGQRRRNGAVPRGGGVVLHCLGRKKLRVGCGERDGRSAGGRPHNPFLRATCIRRS